MHITRLQVSQFEGLETLELEPGAEVNLVTGCNGAGKTSLLEAIRVAFTNRGNRSLLVHDGESGGLILFELSNGTSGRRSVSNKGYTAGPVSLKKDDTYISGAQAFLDRLGLGYSFDPLKFIELRSDEQTETLLEVTPIDLSHEDLIALSGGEELDDVDYDAHPLQVLEQIKDALFEERRVVGRDARDTEGMVEKLRDKVPDAFDRESAESFDLQKAMQALRESRGIRESLAAHKRDIALNYDAIDKLREEIAAIQAENDELESAVVDLVEDIEATEEPEEIEARIEAYQEDQKHLQNLEQADERVAEAEELRARHSELQEMLKEVRATPGRVLAETELPVEGLSIVGGEVAIGGLPISELSAGEQLKVAVDISLATLGELQVVLVDGLEKLDPGNQDYLLSRLTEAGVQAFVTRIADGELRVITDYESGDAVSVEATEDDSDPETGLETARRLLSPADLDDTPF